MELLPTTVDTTTLFAARYHQGEKTYNMYNLGIAIPLQNSPWYYYSDDPQWMIPGFNNNYIADTELASAALAMKPIPYGDDEAWLTAWQNFQKIWNEKLPDIPLYSDEYHDFFSPKLKGWDANDIWSWSSALLDAWVVEG